MKKIVLIAVLLCTLACSGALPGSVFAADSPQGSSVSKVNINQADSLELQALPGVGPALAERIVAYREAHGPFTSAEQLAEVKGISTGKIDKFKDRMTLK